MITIFRLSPVIWDHDLRSKKAQKSMVRERIRDPFQFIKLKIMILHHQNTKVWAILKKYVQNGELADNQNSYTMN